MSYDKEVIKKVLKEKNFTDVEIDYDKVLETVEYENGQYIFTMNGTGYVFIGNTLIDALPGYKRRIN